MEPAEHRLGDGAVQPPGVPHEPGAELARLVHVMTRIRVECPWDARQTHHSLVKHLIEETAEVVDAIEAGSDDDLREELGDLLLQVVFHAEIARGQGRFDIDAVARGIADKLVHRHPYVFADQDLPDDLAASWESAKQAEKQRSSVLDGVPDALNTLARAAKVVSRIRTQSLLPLPSQPITAAETGEQILSVVARAQACGVDADQATREAVRMLEAQARNAEQH